MPTGVSSVRINAEVEAALFKNGEEMQTVRPLWSLDIHARLRVGEAFLERLVEVDVWPNRKQGDPTNHTVKFGRVLSVAHNPHWGNGQGVVVLEFPITMTKRDLPILMSQIATIRTVEPTTEETDEEQAE